MKNLFTLTLSLIMTILVFAQSPQKMSYQAIIRNSSGQLVTKQVVGMKLSILEGSVTGTPVYSETQTPTTDGNGMATIEIGSGNIITGTFAGIDWSAGTYFIKTETDPTGGTSYTITGTSQILSVPYALYAKKAENGSLWSQSESNIYFNSGRVGIGSGNPATYIHAHGAPVSSRGQLSLSSPSGQGTFISFYEENTFKAYLWYDVNDQDLRLQNFTSGDLNLNPFGGKVGIGTNTPGYTLDVSGNLNFSGTFTQNGSPFSISWTNITGKPTTLEGYGITDAVKNTLDINFINSIKKGDMVLTTGGLYGKISEVQENFVKMEVEGVILRVYKNAIRRPPF